MFETYWQLIIHEIRQASKKVNGYPISHEKLGEMIGANRNTTWNLSRPESHHDHLNEPKFSQGMALLEIHAKLMGQMNEATKT